VKSLAALASVVVAQLVLAAVPQASIGSGPPLGPTPPGGGGNTLYALRPDLVIESMTSHNGHAVRVAIRNRGIRDSGWSWLRVRFSSAELGVRYAWMNVPPIPAGLMYDFAFGVEEEVHEGEVVQSIEARADYYGQVTESIESNNVMVVSSSSLF
jgi:hypothetical protein